MYLDLPWACTVFSISEHLNSVSFMYAAAVQMLCAQWLYVFSLIVGVDHRIDGTVKNSAPQLLRLYRFPSREVPESRGVGTWLVLKHTSDML
jgi:hypothetical protein